MPMYWSGGGSGAVTENVQADWNVVDPTSDAYIKNKPAVPAVSRLTVTLTAAGWVSDAQTVTATGVTANNNIIVAPDPDDIDAYTAAGITCTAQATNALTFECATAPETAIDVNVLIIS